MVAASPNRNRLMDFQGDQLIIRHGHEWEDFDLAIWAVNNSGYRWLHKHRYTELVGADYQKCPRAWEFAGQPPTR